MRKSYGALVNAKPGSKPPICYGRDYIIMRDYAPAECPDFLILICDSAYIRDACQVIARQNGCEVWKVKRRSLRVSEINAGIAIHNIETFRRDLEYGHIFPMVDKRFEETKAAVLKYGWFRVVGIVTDKWSKIITGNRDIHDPHHFTVNYTQMQALNEMLAEKEQDGKSTG